MGNYVRKGYNPKNVCRRRGHPLTEDNVVIGNGRRRCKLCWKAYPKRRQIRRTGVLEVITPVAKPREEPKFYNPAWPGVY